jgi:hypothetical protein
MIQNILDNASCKVKNTHPNLHRWKNWEPNTPFAPIYDVPLWIEDFDPWFTEEVIQIIKNNNLGICHDVWKTYNIFDWNYDVIQYLKESILTVYKNYMSSLNMTCENILWIRGWAVNLTKNDGLKLHSHSTHENTYLSGNITISNNKTTTDFVIPHLTSEYGFYKVENIPGRMTLFPSWVQHKVDPILDEERFSIGFDIFTKHSIEYANHTNDPINKSILLVVSE